MKGVIMDFNILPKDMQEKVLKLAEEHPITINEAKELYLMGGEHAEILCELKSLDCPDSIIKLQNQALWDEKNRKIWEELE